jgi:hypothetical protein
MVNLAFCCDGSGERTGLYDHQARKELACLYDVEAPRHAEMNPSPTRYPTFDSLRIDRAE